MYLATVSPPDGLPAQVCVKITDRIDAWLREAYFADLLGRESRALRVYDRYVEVEGPRMRYCLAMEYAEHGDLGAWLSRQGGQDERFVRKEIAGILSALDVLHRGQALHRDLTPFNVFVCAHEQLKLGDFGIAKHQLNRHGVTADAFNPFNAPTEIAWGKVRKWQQRDDIYQVGQLASMLLRGDIRSPMRSKDVRKLPCSDHLKEVIHRCLGAPRASLRSGRRAHCGASTQAEGPPERKDLEPYGNAIVVYGLSQPPSKRRDCCRTQSRSDSAIQARAIDARPRARTA